MSQKRNRLPSDILNFSTRRTDQIAHDPVLADHRLRVRRGHGGPAERFQLKPLNVGARRGSIVSRGCKDTDHVDFGRHSAVRVFPHVHHHRGDRLAYPADPEKRECALLATLNVLFSCHCRYRQGHERTRVLSFAIGRPLGRSLSN
jgi:hypothetical protein